jgi:hypothetical protein
LYPQIKFEANPKCFAKCQAPPVQNRNPFSTKVFLADQGYVLSQKLYETELDESGASFLPKNRNKTSLAQKALAGAKPEKQRYHSAEL